MRLTLPSVLLFALSIAFVACSDRSAAPDETPTGTPGGDAATATPEPATDATPTAEGDGSAEPPAVEAERILEHARVLSQEIGERVAGSEGEEAAIEYIAETFAGYGYEVSVNSFTFEGNRWPPARILFGQTEYRTYAIDGSAGGEVSGPLVYAGLGERGDIEGVDLEGAIALVDRGVIPFAEKVQNTTQAGAVGVIVVNDEPGPLLRATLGVPVDVPVAGVGPEAGESLRQEADAGTESTLSTSGPTTESANVVARAPGTDQCRILTGGHHDSVAQSPGANDNASGTAHVLELARVMAADGLDEGLCFATFGGEESGLFGSQHMAQEMADAGELPEVMFNLDVTGVGMPAGVIGSEALVTRAVEVAQEAGVDAVPSQMPANSGSDHINFERAGSSIVMLTSDDYSTIHSPQDTFDTLEPETLAAIGEAGAVILRDLYSEVAVP